MGGFDVGGDDAVFLQIANDGRQIFEVLVYINCLFLVVPI